MYIDIHIDHVGTQRSSSSCAMLMKLNKAKTAVHGCWLFELYFYLFLVATGFYPFYHSRLSSHACGFKLPYSHLDLP